MARPSQQTPPQDGRRGSGTVSGRGSVAAQGWHEAGEEMEFVGL